MYKKIVVALALDQGHGLRAMAMARRLLDEGGTIVAVHAIEPVPSYANLYLSDHQDQDIKKSIEEQIHERIGEARDADAVVLTGSPGRMIPDHAKQIGADCIVVGSHDPEFVDTFLGSTAARIVRHATCSVHVLR